MEESWIKQYWRPAIAWQYFAVCIFDFIIFPAAYMYFSQQQWNPITLKEGGFYHLAMAAIIGVAAWTRGQEKITKIMNGEEIEKTNTTQTPTGKK
jgi:K+ transporter